MIAYKIRHVGKMMSEASSLAANQNKRLTTVRDILFGSGSHCDISLIRSLSHNYCNSRDIHSHEPYHPHHYGSQLTSAVYLSQFGVSLLLII